MRTGFFGLAVLQTLQAGLGFVAGLGLATGGGGTLAGAFCGGAGRVVVLDCVVRAGPAPAPGAFCGGAGRVVVLDCVVRAGPAPAPGRGCLLI